MRLSNKSTFSLVFSVLLVALFAFIATPAMAQVTATVVGSPAAIDGENRTGVVVEITFSENLNPELKKIDLTDGNDAALGEAIVFSKVSANIYRLKHVTEMGITFRMPGFLLDGGADIRVDASADDVPTPVMLTNDPLYLAGRGYVVVIRADAGTAIPTFGADTVFPTLPAGTPAINWGDVSADEAAMPDLYALFAVEGGGTINLRLNKVPAADATGDPERDGDPNSRSVVINEVMWAYDNALVGQATRTRQQWIEISNRQTKPRLLTQLQLTTSKAFPAPDAETDRLSNNPAYNNTWNITGKGQHGNSGGTVTPNTGVSQFEKVDFVSMIRVSYNNGWDSGRWDSAGDYYLPSYKGSPGAKNQLKGIQGARTVAGATNPPKDKIIVNEIGLSKTTGHDWIELHNVSDSAVNIKKWTISLTTGYGNERIIYRFRDDDKFDGDYHLQSIPAGGYLLLVFEDPADTPLAVGVDVLLSAKDQAFGHSDHKFLNVKSAAAKAGGEGVVGSQVDGISDNSEWLIIIRSNHENKFLQSSHHIQDVAGPGGEGTNFKVQDINSADPRKNKTGGGGGGGDIWHTEMFPLQNQNHDDFLRRTDLRTSDETWYRRLDKGGGQGWKKESFGLAKYAGIGYDRGADPGKYKGTPGYPNDSYKEQVGEITDGRVIISELMLTTDNGRYPQWIELHNTSKTSAVNLAVDADDDDDDDDDDDSGGWKLVIENHDSGQWVGERDLIATINFKIKDDVKSIPPNQTVLIVSTISSRTSSRNLVDHFPQHRVYDVYTNDRAAFYMPSRRSSFLNTNGFHIKLIDAEGNVSDEIGNLDGNNRTYDVPYSWEWPAAMTEDEERSSLIRLKNADGTYRIGVPNRAVKGDMRGAPTAIGEQVDATSAWKHAVDTKLNNVQDTYYGNDGDFGTPGHTSNTPLPVSLSFFRPTLENGEIVIRWTTESELDNAGFNILRGNSRHGEFKQVNSELVQGAGTTGERNTYKWVDESAKLGVVYYYQIEDVSFAGEHQTLTTTKLKGLISANNKLTTLWGGLKSQQD